ncbi:MAG: hypothetical protein KJ710_04560 [Candidatus Omnitrophica bacterium]|nr:hypothetical protein [Candidatus Omnitrophota bacterium]MBU1923511.1 hypothetical protein [Candidatus Omnitrophota bacterium]
MKTWLCICFLVIYLIVPGMSFCQQQEGTPETRFKQGVVTQLDSIGSLLVIFDGSENLRFSVEQSARIYRGTDNIMLDDLESNDTVTVEYYKSSDGVLRAVSITDNNIAASF